jgi:hypothetical protein
MKRTNNSKSLIKRKRKKMKRMHDSKVFAELQMDTTVRTSSEKSFSMFWLHYDYNEIWCGTEV